MRIYPASDWSIVNTGKTCAIFDHCVLRKATAKQIEHLNKKYAFVFPLVLLMECAKKQLPYVYKNIENIEHFLIISTHKTQTMIEDLIPCDPSEIMKKDLGVSLFRTPEEDSNLVYLIPYDKKARMDLLHWAENKPAEDYYNTFNHIEQRFQIKCVRRPQDIVESVCLYGLRRGERYIQRDNIEIHVARWVKAFKKRYGFNPFYGNDLKDVMGLVKMVLGNTSILKVIDDLSKTYQFDPSWPKKQIASRPYYPHPDDYAKYTYYFYFISMCITFCGYTMPKSYLRDWEYAYYLPFCPIISADKRFFKNLKQAMKSIGTDTRVGITISDRIHIWGEDNI